MDEENKHIDPEIALENYKADLRVGAKAMYEAEVKRFLDYCGGNLTREILMRYLLAMKKKGYSPGTITKVTIPTLRKMYKVNGIKWPLRRGEWPGLKEGDVYAPALEPGLVSRMIIIAKTNRVTRYDRALLALATIYGLRRIEMSNLSKGDIDLEHGIMLVRTAKGGRERWHMIPEGISDLIRPIANLKEPLGGDYVSKSYRRIESAAGIGRMEDVGYHAIRRILVRLLVEANLPAYTVDNFMRWKRGGSDMQRVYYNTTVVGERGQRVEIGKMDREVDEAVFKVHPFLKVWVGEKAEGEKESEMIIERKLRLIK